MSRRVLIALVFLAIGVIVWFAAREHLSLETIADQEQRLRQGIESQPIRAFLVGFVIYVLVSLFPGTSGKSIICGWLFGFWQALIMVTGALTLAALGGFLVAQYLLRDLIRQRFARAVARVDRALEREGSFYLLTVRMLHVPFTLVNYLSGASGIETRTFAWTTFVGLIPSTMIFVGVGAGLPTIEQLAQEGAKGLMAPPLLVALVLMGGAPWLLRRLIRFLRPGVAANVDPFVSRGES